MLKIIFALYVKLFARNVFIKFNKFIYHLSIRGLGIYNYENMSVSGEEHFINKTIKPLGKSNKEVTIFDVGANRGDYTNLLLKKIDNVKIFSFEPHPKTFKELFKNCKNDKVKIFNCALSSEEGFFELYDYDSKDGSSHASLSSEIFTTVHGSHFVAHTVSVSTIDKICADNYIERINFLKIDVEGYELEVLKGASNLLKNLRVDIIQFEFTQINTTTRVYFKDFWEKLSENFNIYRLLPNSLLEIKKYDPTMHEIFGYQNFVAINKRKANETIF